MAATIQAPSPTPWSLRNRLLCNASRCQFVRATDVLRKEGGAPCRRMNSDPQPWGFWSKSRQPQHGKAVEARCQTGRVGGAPQSWRRQLSGLLHSGYDADILALAVPALFTLMIEPVMSLVDCAIIGRIGATALAGTGLSVFILNLSLILFGFLSMVTTPAVARAMANGDLPRVHRITADGLWVGAACGVAFTTAIYIACPAILATIGATPAVAEQALLYTRCRVLGVPAQLAMYVLAGTLRGNRDNRTALAAAGAAVAANFFLDIALVFGLGWGVAGAALATSASQYLNAAHLWAAVAREGLLDPAQIWQVPRWGDVRGMLGAGAALQARSLSLWALMVGATAAAMRLGTEALAAHEILRQIWAFCMWSFWALNASAAPLVADHLGRGDFANARGVLARIVQLGFGLAAACAAVVGLPGAALPRLFTQDPQVVSMVAGAMPVVVAFLPVEAAERALEGGMLGAQEVTWVARNTALTAAAAAAALLAAQRRGWGLLGIWCAIKLIPLGRAAGATLRFASPQSPLGGFQAVTLRRQVPVPAAGGSKNP